MELPAVEIDGDRLHAGHRDGWPQDHVGPGCRYVREMVLKPALRLQLPRCASQAYRVAGLAGDDDLCKGAPAVNYQLAKALNEHLLKLAFQGLVETDVADRSDRVQLRPTAEDLVDLPDRGIP